MKNTYLVIGGAGLIGCELVDNLRLTGNTVYSCDTNVSEEGEFDVTMNAEFEDDVYLNIESILRNHGQIDGIVNLAYPRNKNYGRKLEDVIAQDFVENVSSHLACYFNVMKVASLMLPEMACSIVNFSSIYGVISPRFEIYENTGITMPVEYSASKSGLIHLTKYFAKYFQKTNLRFNCISPGGIYDNQDNNFVKNYEVHTGNYGMLKRSDLSSYVTFLLSNESKFINGQNLVVDDGFTL